MDIIINSDKVNITIQNDITGKLIMFVYYDSLLQLRITVVLISVNFNVVYIKQVTLIFVILSMPVNKHGSCKDVLLL